jgi:hypothetical protein
MFRLECLGNTVILVRIYFREAAIYIQCVYISYGGHLFMYFRTVAIYERISSLVLIPVLLLRDRNIGRTSVQYRTVA